MFLFISLLPPQSGVVAGLEQKVWSSKLYRNTAGIRQEGHPEFKVLPCSSKKSGSKASVYWQTYIELARLSLRNTGKMT